MNNRNKTIFGATLIILALMGFGFSKKTSGIEVSSTDPYKKSSVNHIYNLLFCDDLELYKFEGQENVYPFDLLFSTSCTMSDLQRIIEDENLESRTKILAYNKQVLLGHQINQKELLGIIVEIGMDEGLDVLASYADGSARYINHSEKILIWEKPDEESMRIKEEFFKNGMNIVNQIGPWDKDRRPHPKRGNARITFLVSDGFYFGEGPIDELFSDPFSSQALNNAAEFMGYITEKAISDKGK